MRAASLSTFRFILSLLLTFAVTAVRAEVVYWSFEAGSPSAIATNTSSTISGITADNGAGTASGVHASANTIWSTPVGNGTLHSFSADHWGVGDYWQFQINSLGFAPLDIRWSQTSSATGPSLFHLSYSIDGVSFTSLPSYLVLTNSGTANNSGTGLMTLPWNGNYQSAYGFTNHVNSITTLQNQPALYFRLVCDSSPGSTAGTARIDEVIIDLTAIPEPRTALLAASCMLTCYFTRKHR